MTVTTSMALFAQDEIYIRRAIELAEISEYSGERPFGALVVKRGEVVSESLNCTCVGMVGHAEVWAINKAMARLGTTNLSDCTLYTNFEPCAMCSFIIRDFNVGRVVWSVSSPYWGGATRWNILGSEINAQFTSAEASTAPELCGDVLKSEGSKIFDRLGWSVHKALN